GQASTQMNMVVDSQVDRPVEGISWSNVLRQIRARSDGDDLFGKWFADARTEREYLEACSERYEYGMASQIHDMEQRLLQRKSKVPYGIAGGSQLRHKYETRANSKRLKVRGTNTATDANGNVTSNSRVQCSEPSKISRNDEMSVNHQTGPRAGGAGPGLEDEYVSPQGNTLEDAENMFVEEGRHDSRAKGDGCQGD
ncbi:hypothetical protein CBR_g54069, partial [Chara braunii]